MKKILLLTLCVLFVISMCSCGKDNEDFLEPVNFYYCNEEISYNSTSGVIHAEIREGADFGGDISEFLHAYLLGPQSDHLQTLIPSDVYLISCDIEEDVVNIKFSSHFSRLSGVKLTTACTALLMSIHDYMGAQTLNIYANNEKIDDKDVFTITVEDIVLIDTVATQE